MHFKSILQIALMSADNLYSFCDPLRYLRDTITLTCVSTK